MANNVEHIGNGQYRVSYIDLCRNCGGQGSLQPEDHNSSKIECTVCKGSGRVTVTKDIQVSIKPYKLS